MTRWRNPLPHLIERAFAAAKPVRQMRAELDEMRATVTHLAEASGERERKIRAHSRALANMYDATGRVLPSELASQASLPRLRLVADDDTQAGGTTAQAG